MRGWETEIGGENVKDNVRIDGGGGGGAFGNTAIAAGNGGSGVVIIRYALSNDKPTVLTFR